MPKGIWSGPFGRAKPPAVPTSFAARERSTT
jgi:hypothetical protein